MMNDILHDGPHGAFTGMSLVENPEIPEKAPRMQLSNKVDVSQEFREEFDAWLLKKFGADRVVCMIDGKLVTNPANAARFARPK